MSIPKKGRKVLASDVIAALSRSIKETAKDLDELVGTQSVGESLRAHPRVQRQPEEEEGTT